MNHIYIKCASVIVLSVARCTVWCWICLCLSILYRVQCVHPCAISIMCNFIISRSYTYRTHTYDACWMRLRTRVCVCHIMCSWLCGIQVYIYIYIYSPNIGGLWFVSSLYCMCWWPSVCMSLCCMLTMIAPYMCDSEYCVRIWSEPE